MTPAEKRYFKRHYGSESNTLTHLYDAINLQKEYDEEAIKTQFPGKVATNLKVYKFQLEQLLLKSLTSHRHFSTTTSKIRMGLEHCDILIEKNLLQMAEKQLEKTKKLCVSTEQFSYMPIIIQKEAKLESIQSQGFSGVNTQKLKETEYYANKILAHQLESSKLNSLINLYLEQNFPVTQEDIDLSLKETEIKSYANGSVPASDKILKEITIALKAFLQKDEKATQLLTDVLQKFKKSKSLKHQFSQIYLICLRCAIDQAFFTKNYGELVAYIKTGLNFTQKEEPFKAQYYYFAAYEIKHFTLQDHTHKVFQEIIPKHEKVISEFEGEETLPFLIYLSWCSMAAIMDGKTDQGLKCVKRLQLIPQENIPLAPALGQILEFVIHFETPNFQQMLQLLDQIKLDKKASLPRDEKRLYSAFLTFIDQLSTNPKMAAELAGELLKELAAQEKSTLHKIFYYLSLDCWLQAIAQESTFLSELSSRV